MNNNDDLNDDFGAGPDLDPSGDFGEFDQETEKGSFGELVKKNPVIKIGLVGAALLVVIGGITLFGGSKQKGPDSVVGKGQDVKEVAGTKELSPEMKQVMEEHNQQMIEDAQKAGTSVIPQPIEPPKQQLTVPADEAPTEDPLLRWRQMQDERLKAQQAEQTQQQKKADPGKEQAMQNLVSAMSAQMSQILSGKKIENLKTMDITSIQDIQAARQAQAAQLQQSQLLAAQQNPAVDPTTGQPITPAKILLPAGAIEYGQLLVEANSDIPGPIVAMVVSGPFAGSRILGTFTKQEEYLVMQFTTLVNKKGVSVPIQAFALDPNTTLSGMATDVDHRYLERVILPAAADFVKGMGEAYANQQGQTVAVTGGDTVVQSTPPINTKEQFASGVSKAADKIGTILTDEGGKTQILVRVRAGTPVGILFMNPVTDQDFLAGQNAPATTRTLQQQQQQQQSLLQQQSQAQAGSPLYLLQGLQNAQGVQATSQPNGQTVGTNGISSTTGAPFSSTIKSTQDYLNGK